MFDHLNPSISFLLSQNGVYPYGAPSNGTSKSSFISVRTIYIQFRILGKKGKLATHVFVYICLAIPGLHQQMLSFHIQRKRTSKNKILYLNEMK